MEEEQFDIKDFRKMLEFNKTVIAVIDNKTYRFIFLEHLLFNKARVADVNKGRILVLSKKDLYPLLITSKFHSMGYED